MSHSHANHSTQSLSPRAKPEQRHPQSIRARDAAALLGVSESTFWNWQARIGMPRARKIGPKTTVWDRDELIAWRDAQGERAAA